MALSSWNGLYNHVEQRFMLKRRYKLFFLLKAIAQHADEFGLCYPGPDRLKKLTGLGTDKELNEALQFLVDGEYIKIWETYNPRRKVYDRDYQVSPFALYVREELQGYCEHIWETGERDFDKESAIVIKRNGQPESESESNQPESNNQNQNHHHHPTDIASKKLTTGSAPDYTNQSAGPQRKKRKPSSGKARSTEKENPQAGGRAPVPEKLDLRKYQSPLPHDQEDQAQDLVVMFRMRISQARGLVATYAPELVARAAVAVQDAMKRGAVNNPPGLLTHFLKRGAISPEDKQLYPTRAEQIEAQNAQFTYQDDEDQTQGDENNAKL